jgi:hypothetical protein
MQNQQPQKKQEKDEATAVEIIKPTFDACINELVRKDDKVNYIKMKSIKRFILNNNHYGCPHSIDIKFMMIDKLVKRKF